MSRRGYEQSDLIEGVEIAGSSKIHEVIKNGYPKLLKHRDGRPVPGRAGALPDQGDVQGWPRDHPVGFIGYQYFAY